jgi:hypothetical protein
MVIVSGQLFRDPACSRLAAFNDLASGMLVSIRIRYQMKYQINIYDINMIFRKT